MTMPMGPMSAEPITSAVKLMMGCTWTELCMTLGEITLSVIFCATIVTMSVHNASIGLNIKPRTVAIAALTQGPTTGTKCMMPVKIAMSAAYGCPMIVKPIKAKMPPQMDVTTMPRM